MALKDLPAQAQPRERLAAHGPSALSDIELLAIVLRTGMAGKGVLQLAQELLQLPGRPGLSGLLQAGHADLKAIKGLGPSKCAHNSWPCSNWRAAPRPSNCASALPWPRPRPWRATCSCTWRHASTRCSPCCSWTASTG